jgi:hypothetical protein
MKLLRQSTIQVIQFGVFVDKDDAVTLEVGLAAAMDNASTGIRLSKDGADFVDRNDSTTPAYDAMGSYRLTLNATDTVTLGNLRITFEESTTCLPVWDDWTVITAKNYDAFVLGTDALPADFVKVKNNALGATKPFDT